MTNKALIGWAEVVSDVRTTEQTNDAVLLQVRGRLLPYDGVWRHRNVLVASAGPSALLMLPLAAGLAEILLRDGLARTRGS